MINFTVKTQIARPVSEVFAYVTDPATLSSWQRNTVVAEPLQDGPLGVGARLREVHRGPGRRELTSVVEVSEFKTDEVFALKMIEGAMPLDARIEMGPTGAGTGMSFTVSGQLHGLARLAQPLLRLALRRQFAAHCTALKEVLEHPS